MDIDAAELITLYRERLTVVTEQAIVAEARARAAEKAQVRLEGALDESRAENERLSSAIDELQSEG